MSTSWFSNLVFYHHDFSKKKICLRLLWFSHLIMKSPVKHFFFFGIFFQFPCCRMLSIPSPSNSRLVRGSSLLPCLVLQKSQLCCFSFVQYFIGSREPNDKRIKIKNINPGLQDLSGFGSRQLNDLPNFSEGPGRGEVIKLLEISCTKGTELCSSLWSEAYHDRRKKTKFIHMHSEIPLHPL
jgi:hypothetical protein